MFLARTWGGNFNKKGVLVYGHEHIRYIKKNNVGAISLPRCDNKPTYVIYENKKFTIYDIDRNIFDSIEL